MGRLQMDNQTAVPGDVGRSPNEGRIARVQNPYSPTVTTSSEPARIVDVLPDPFNSTL